MADHDCIQERRISTTEANVQNLCRSLDELRKSLDKNTTQLQALTVSQTEIRKDMNNVGRSQGRMVQWADRLFLAFLGLACSVIGGLMMARFGGH